MIIIMMIEHDLFHIKKISDIMLQTLAGTEILLLLLLLLLIY
jgi:hypothetical protein